MILFATSRHRLYRSISNKESRPPVYDAHSNVDGREEKANIGELPVCLQFYEANMTEQEKLLITKYDLLFEARLTRVEATMDHVDATLKEIKTDLRWMLGIMLGFSGILLSLMAKGFNWLG